MSKDKILFMGTPEISSIYLKSLIKNKYNIVAVYTQPPRKKGRGMKIQESPVQKLASENEINLYTPSDFKEEKTKKILQNINPDLIIVMGYGLKLPNFVLEMPRLGCINIHVSLLPRWRGAAPIEHSLLNGDNKTGITIFKLVEEMDAGPIIASKSILLNQDINKDDLTKKLNILGTDFLNIVLPDILINKIIYKDQENSKITYAHKISTNLRKLDFSEDVETIHNKIRAFSSRPAAWLFYKNERIKILKSQYVKGKWDSSIIINDQFNIGCKNGKICPQIIQREGRKPIHLKDFLRGFEFIIGSKVNV